MGFTLIEMLAVITIIVILAGLVVGGMGFVNDRQATEKAKTQIAMLSAAIEEYKLDHGSYPATANSSSGLTGTNSITVYDMSETSQPAKSLLYVLYTKGVEVLDDDNEDYPIYIPELDPDNNKQGWTSSSSDNILDPWGNPYRYRTAYSKTGSSNSRTQNPDFDLWSSGKDGATSTNPASDTVADDIGNF